MTHNAITIAKSTSPSQSPLSGERQSRPVIASADPIIQIANVSKEFNDFQALKNIDLSVASGSTVVICGPSGSGKSTLLRCINGLEPYQAGTIQVMGRLIDQRTISEGNFRAHIGMVFQRFSLYPHMTVIRNLTLALRKVVKLKKAEAEDRATAMLELVGLPEKANARPAELSGGQQQRVAIARALVMEPKIMLFDEPTSALDPEIISEVLDVMRKLASEGMTMLVVTHEMGFAREAADEIVFMDDGTIVEIGQTEDFFRSARTERAQQFLNRIFYH